MDNQKVKKEKARPYFYKTNEKRNDAIRRSKTHYMLSKIWYCELCKHNHFKTKNTKILWLRITNDNINHICQAQALKDKRA